MESRSGDQGLSGVHAALLRGSRSARYPERGRLRHRRGADTDPQAVRKRPDAGERHASGREPQGCRASDDAAGHKDKHQPDRLHADQAGPDAAVRRQDLGTAAGVSLLTAGRQIIPAAMLTARASSVVLKKKAMTPWASPSRRIALEAMVTSEVCDVVPSTN